MRSEFENWHSNSKDKSTSSAFAAGWMCQQSKVDELQKRVDAALKMISINRGFAWGSVSISQLEQALKGGGK